MRNKEQEETEMLFLVAHIPVKVNIYNSWLKPKTKADNTVLDKQNENEIQRASP